jgi:hypothetical protein
MDDVPEPVRAKAIAAGATRWLADLPALVDGLVREWSLTLGPAYADATEAYVVQARLADGTTSRTYCPPVTATSSSTPTGCWPSRSTTSASSCARTPVELMAGDPRDRARWLADRTGLDATAIWEWGVVERVSTGLVAASIGLQPVGDQMLDAADRIARDFRR